MPAEEINVKDYDQGGVKYPVRPELLEKHVCFAYTTRGNDIYYLLPIYLLHQMHVFKQMSCFVAIAMWGPSVELLFTTLRDYEGWDYVHILDSDVAPAKDTTLRLMDREKDIIANPVWFYDGANNSIHLNYHPNDKMERQFVPKQSGLEEVFCTSFGSVVISRRVFETFKMEGEHFTRWSPLISPKFKEAAPDSIFFIKARELGFQVWLDWDAEFATHHKYVSLNAPTIESFVKNRFFGSKGCELYPKDGKPDEQAITDGDRVRRFDLAEAADYVRGRQAPDAS